MKEFSKRSSLKVAIMQVASSEMTDEALSAMLEQPL